MTVTCFIRYEIDPFGKAAFEQYARAWGQAIPNCGAELIGYFAPHEGSATTAYAAYNIENLAAYEAYRARLAADPAGKANYEFARREKFILKEDRIFLKLVSAPHGPRQVSHRRNGQRRDRGMIAVIFEVEPAEGKRDAYLGIAAELKPLLDGIDGFISVERFQSLTDPRRVLSLSFWRDEEAVKAWRNTEEHRQAQKAGRGGIFAGYRLRIAHVVRDYGLNERAEAPEDSRMVNG